ncbi:MAG: DNA methylase [Lachnospiraceae bacterium]|nr:DNA methylase [Lachnospiraceae bacterium]
MEEQAYRYIAIDLKSFYASVECVDRGLDPLTARLVVADESRTAKTICLAVSPALKKLGLTGRPRLFEVMEKTRGIDYIVAPPRMARYMEVSTKIYGIYLRYIAPEDIFAYSVDEVFIDTAAYLHTYRMTAGELASTMLKAVLRETGITATVGLGTNLYLAKVAMDIMAKRSEGDAAGLRIAGLTELSYRRQLWEHRPLTDFWRVGFGYARRLEGVGLYTMGDIARCSIGRAEDFHREELLYRLFGVNAELLIDHAWGWEPCEMKDIKAYRPANHSLSSGQVLTRPYSFDEARIVVREMTEALALDLVSKGLVTDRLTLTIGYDVENMKSDGRQTAYRGKVKADHYGRRLPAPAQGSQKLPRQTASATVMTEQMDRLFQGIADPDLLIRRLNVVACEVEERTFAQRRGRYVQLNLLTDYPATAEAAAAGRAEERRQKREQQMQETMLTIRARYGKNAVLKGYNLLEGATARQRNAQIGGHRA